ncbi:MAG: 4-hydroxythreonine-4-phosphate dehydrogenase PdxA [Opitutales bacterium]|nr:4-hydroxythreonine-4-phosphate dehydrogenase PdxA [Opitutales bacterium]
MPNPGANWQGMTTMTPDLKPLAITCGDPSGVGPEIIAHWAREGAGVPVHLFAPAALLKQTGLPGVSVGSSSLPLSDGQPTEAGALAAWQAMEAAAAAVRNGEARAVVTGPVSKSALAGVGYRFAGQTEFFAHEWGGEPTMGFVGKALRVVLATWHIPLASVPSMLARHPELIERAVNRAGDLVVRLGQADRSPRIGVCGLNPHAGEGGLLGTEERDWLDPWLDRLRARWPGLSTTLPADTLFFRAMEGEFDVIVALYHDQGLAPLKLVSFHDAVNITLGLPYVRTSPDHGTAFAIAGKGIARTDSFARAVDLADRLSR